ncbi:hypothetical protein C479_03591 [Halovivax asiaticus JCM 14624]|uniref:Methyltransferase FkbM domain-containing protein n=2 Tax=Halovivax asiaticus TaxID=332953 RepID=M0BUW2_9EURY|nr:hypothetical protein C479_03591 [Halovivax asiaticus JCM 14624]
MIEGATAQVRRLYDATLRRRLPRIPGVYNGVVTRRYYLLDLQARLHEPDYKATLVDSMMSAIAPGDTVVEIGGGYGVCTARAAIAVGDEGRVVSYEANAAQVSAIEEALELTGEVRGDRPGDRVDVRQAVVGSDVKIYGSMAGASRIDASDLPACDVLVMDCEGAERAVVRDMEIDPRAVVVESHPQQGSSTDVLTQTLSERGYAIETTRVTVTADGPKDIVTATREIM